MLHASRSLRWYPSLWKFHGRGAVYLFCPAPSRRLGLSLGVELIPSKICSLGCVYNESSPSIRLTVQRTSLVSKAVELAEIEEIASHIKVRCLEVHVVLFTNGTLFDRGAVRCDAAEMDLVIASFYAAGSGARDSGGGKGHRGVLQSGLCQRERDGGFASDS